MRLVSREDMNNLQLDDLLLLIQRKYLSDAMNHPLDVLKLINWIGK